MIKAVVNNSKSLIANRGTPTYGPKNAKVALIEFLITSVFGALG